MTVGKLYEFSRIIKLVTRLIYNSCCVDNHELLVNCFFLIFFHCVHIDWVCIGKVKLISSKSCELFGDIITSRFPLPFNKNCIVILPKYEFIYCNPFLFSFWFG